MSPCPRAEPFSHRTGMGEPFDASKMPSVPPSRCFAPARRQRRTRDHAAPRAESEAPHNLQSALRSTQSWQGDEEGPEGKKMGGCACGVSSGTRAPSRPTAPVLPALTARGPVFSLSLSLFT